MCPESELQKKLINLADFTRMWSTIFLNLRIERQGPWEEGQERLAFGLRRLASALSGGPVQEAVDAEMRPDVAA